jgi:hypothetical protein
VIALNFHIAIAAISQSSGRLGLSIKFKTLKAQATSVHRKSCCPPRSQQATMSAWRRPVANPLTRFGRSAQTLLRCLSRFRL